MTEEKDLGSDAARSDPEVADTDRDKLKKRAQQNIGRLNPGGKLGGNHPDQPPAEKSAETVDQNAQEAAEKKRADKRSPKVGSSSDPEAAEPSPE